MKVRQQELLEEIDRSQEVPPLPFFSKSGEELVTERLEQRSGEIVMVGRFRLLPEEGHWEEGVFYPHSIGCLNCSQGSPCGREEDCEGWCCAGCLKRGKIQLNHFVCVLPYHREQ